TQRCFLHNLLNFSHWFSGNISSTPARRRWGGLLLGSGGGGGGGAPIPERQTGFQQADQEIGAPGRWRRLRPWASPSIQLVVFAGRIIVVTCPFTSFIAKSAGKTARFWSVPAIGKALNARNAAQRSSRRNFRSSLRPMRRAAPVPCRNAVAVDAGRGVGVIEAGG